ncbi:MAG: hypothetical protein P8Q97_12900 [Myxococcota bacterium]|jgi:tetratricopeptide (TPR) repeat protein|nr:hypothetical protein [Myxococcota bacterium]
MRAVISRDRICVWAAFWALALLCLAAPSGSAPRSDPDPLMNSAPTSGDARPNSDARYRSELERIWLAPGVTFTARGQKIRRRALALGVGSLDSPARALIAGGEEGTAFGRRELSVKLAPDLPLAHSAMAAAHWDEGEYAAALAEYGQSIVSIPRHLEASVWLVGSLLMILAGALIGGAGIFILASGALVLSPAAHDLGDGFARSMPPFARAALLASLLGLPVLAGEGLLGVGVVLLGVAVVYGRLRDRVVLALAALVFLVGLYPVLQASGKILSALNADPLASASLALIRGSETPQQLALLLETVPGRDPLVDRSLAVRARRLGANRDASERFLRIVEADPRDSFSLTVLGNIAFEGGDTQGAIEFYERGRRGRAQSAELMFDLSEAYAKVFRMEDGEFALARAQEMDSVVVAEFLALNDPNFVADPPFSLAPVRKRMIRASDGWPMVRSAARLLAPGWLGETAGNAAAGLAGIFLLGLLVQGRFGHARQCLRCGRRLCRRCDGEVEGDELCEACHHIFRKPEDTDPRLRTRRIEVLRSRADRLEKIGIVASIAVPGLAGFRARRPELALVSLILFFAGLLFLLWHRGVVPDPLAVGSAGIFILGSAAFLVAILYLGVLFSSLISWRPR